MKGETVDIEMMVHRITPDAVLCSTDGDIDNSVWLPKKLLRAEEEFQAGKAQILTMPEWLAYKKDIA